MKVRRLLFPLAAIALVGAGCADREPLSAHVHATNFREFTWWRSEVARDVPPQRWAEFNGAVDEIRYDLMSKGVTGSDAIGEALAVRINHKTFDEVLRTGDQLKLARLEASRDELKTIVDANALVGTRADDDASREGLQRRTSEQRERLDGLLREIDEVRQQLVAHGGSLASATAVNPVAAQLTREQALSDFDRIIRDRLSHARYIYGDWPSRIDRLGRDLPPHLREEFDQKRGVAAAKGHLVIPVYIRAKWRLFDDVVKYPEFSLAVTANLTPADRREIEKSWANSEAEIWARRQALKDSPDEAVANIDAQLKKVIRPEVDMPYVRVHHAAIPKIKMELTQTPPTVDTSPDPDVHDHR